MYGAEEKHSSTIADVLCLKLEFRRNEANSKPFNNVAKAVKSFAALQLY